MKVLIWNVRGIGKVEKQREAKDYIRAQEADFIGLVETKVRSGKAARMTRCLGKDCKAITVENAAGNGRIWLIWNINSYKMNEIQRSDQALSCSCWDKRIEKFFVSYFCLCLKPYI